MDELDQSLIRTDPATSEEAVAQALKSADYRTKERIEKRWRSFLENGRLIESLPISHQAKKEDNYEKKDFPDQYISLPLLGGGEIRLSRNSTVWEGGVEISNLILSVKTTDAKGEQIDIPDFEMSKYGHSYGYGPTDFLELNSQRKIGLSDKKGNDNFERKIKGANKFLALFDPQKDIDLEKLAHPTPVQQACLKAFKITPPKK